MFDISKEIAIGNSVKDILPDLHKEWEEYYNRISNYEDMDHYEYYSKSKDRYYSIYPYRPKEGQIAILVSDNTDQIRREEEITYLNYHDHLTGLFTRKFYEEELKRLDTQRSLPLSLIMGDVNGLKLVNDSFGHQIGDILLVKVAEILKKACHSDDIIARVGGDEFIILLPNTDHFKTQKIISRIKEHAKNEKVYNLDISISFGYDIKTCMEQDIDEVFKSAENRMYKHKLYESKSTKSDIIYLIMNTLFEKETREMSHSNRVSETCEKIAEAMNLDKDHVSQIKIAGLMHDIGNIGINYDLFKRNELLTEAERKEINKHTEIGYRILNSKNEFAEIAEYVLCHHERWDGKGIPKKLKADQIPLPSRIIAVADSYDAMTNMRTYKKVLNKNEAIVELKRCSGTQFDGEVVDIFIDLLFNNSFAVN